MEKLKPVNRWLPYAADIAAEPDGNFGLAVEKLKLLAGGDTVDEEDDTAPTVWNEKGIPPHLRDIENIISLELKFTEKELGEFLQVSYRLIVSSRLRARTETKLLRCITSVLRRAKADAVVARDVSLDATPLLTRLLERLVGLGEVPQPLTCSNPTTAALRNTYMSAIYHLRHYYSQESAVALLETLGPDLGSVSTYQSFQSLTILVAMLPTQLPPGMYDKLMPRWLETWQLCDRCPEWELLWLRLFCRARKHTEKFDWSAHLPMFFSYLLSVFNLPMASSGPPDMRKFPQRIRVLFQPPPHSYNRLLLMAKLVVFFLGKGGDTTVDVPLRVPSPEEVEVPPPDVPVACSAGARHLVMLLWSLRTFFNPSNSGPWHDELSAFLSFLSSTLARCIGWQKADADHGVTRWVTIPERDVDVVVQAILPLAHMSLYSKRPSAVISAEQTLKDLAFIRPQTVARLTLPVLISALDPSSLTTTHQAPAALRALACLVMPLLHPVPYLLDSLPTLLSWSLPGLDSNDIIKTMNTIAFYVALLDWIPVRADVPSSTHDPVSWGKLLQVNGSQAAADPEVFDRALELAPVLADWALAVLERCLVMLQNKDSMHTVGGLGGLKAALGKAEAGMTLLARYLFRQLSTQMDETVRRQALDKVLAFALANTLGQGAAKDASYLFEAFVASSPSQTLSHVVPALAEGIRAAAAPRLLTWRTRLLAGSVRFAGPALLGQLGKIEAVLAVTLEHEDKDVRKAAGKLLRRAMQSLVEIYPMDTHSHRPSQIAHFLTTPVADDEVDAVWHVPSEEELRAAMGLVKTHLIGAIESLQSDPAVRKAAEDISVAAKRELEERWRRRLKLIFNGLRGIVSTLFELPGPQTDDAAVKVGARLVLSRADAETAGFFLGLRGRLATALHGLLPLITREDGPLNRDTKALKHWIKSADEVITVRAAYCMSDSQMYRQTIMYAMSTVRNTMVEGYRQVSKRYEMEGLPAVEGRPGFALPCGYSRRFFVERVYLHHLVRASQASFRLPRLARDADADATGISLYAKQLFADLIALSSYNISTVRAQAQDAVSWAASRFPWHMKAALPPLIASLSTGAGEATPSEIHEKATGAAFILRQTTALRQIAGNWFLNAQLLRTLADSSRMISALAPDKQETLTKRVSALTASYLEVWETQSIYSSRWQAEYDATVNHLMGRLGEAGGGGLHWRYQLLVTWEVLHLSKQGAQAPMPVWNLILQGLSAGNGQPLQKLSIAGLYRLLAFALPGDQPANNLNVKPPSPLNTDYVVLPDPATDFEDEEKAQLVSSDLVDSLTAPAFLRTLLEALAYAHKEVGGGGASGPALWSAGVEELLLDAWSLKGWAMMHTRLMYSSHIFASRHAHLMRLLFRAVGPRLLAPLAEAVESVLLENPPQEHERVWFATVGEVVAGLVSEATRADVPDSRRMKVWTAVTPLIERTLPRLSLDYTNDWADALRFAATRRAPEALYPLTDMLVQKVVAALGNLAPGAPAVASVAVGDDYNTQAKWLRLLQPLLIEALGEPATRERGQAMCARLVAPLLSNLGHPYKACREEVSRTLFLMFGHGRLPLSGPAAGGVDVIEHVHRVLQAEPAADADVQGLAAETAKRLKVDDEDAQGRMEVAGEEAGGKGVTQEEITRRRETVLRWVLVSSAGGDLWATLSQVLPLLPLVYDCLRDRDEELSTLGKAATRLLARSMWLRTRRLSGEGDDLERLTATLLRLAGHSSWYVRLEAASAVAVMALQHRTLLKPEEAGRVLETLVGLLGDERKEVQDQATKGVSYVLSSSELGRVRALAEETAKRALATTRGRVRRRKDAKVAPADEAAEKARLKRLFPDTLLLCSVVLSYPYEVPSFLPQTIATLAKLINEPPSFQTPIRTTLTDFKRTHQDEWDVRHRYRFNEDQLDALSDVLVSPHYYS